MGQKAVLAAGRHKSNDFYFFRGDYDFDELASNEGSDSDGDGLPDSFEGNEACFYKKMGWVAGDAVAADVIKADLVGLESGMKSEFDGNIDKCAGWSGIFGARRKREAGETETDTEVADVPSVMESGSSALSWLRSAVRKTRSAEPDNNKKNSRKSKNSKGGKNPGKGRNGKTEDKKKNSRKSKNSKGGKKPGKGRNGKTENKKKNSRKSKNSKGGKKPG